MWHSFKIPISMSLLQYIFGTVVDRMKLTYFNMQSNCQNTLRSNFWNHLNLWTKSFWFRIIREFVFVLLLTLASKQNATK